MSRPDDEAARSTVGPYGSWPSPITAAVVASGGVRLAQPMWSGDDLYWIEGRPDEGGRNAIVRRAADGGIADAIPAGFNARTLAHEYGGGSYWLHGTTVFFANFADQRLYRVDPGEPPRPITPEPLAERAERFADGVVTSDGATIICVRERHLAGREAVNELVALPADGSAPPRVLVGGNAFYSFPRLSPDGRRLAWTAWNHPQMPWDGTELWVVEVDQDASGALQLGGRRRVAGGPTESIFQPAFAPDGTLHFVSDRTGWWNLYADGGPGAGAVPLCPAAAEFGAPQWVFALSTYTFLPDGTIVALAGGEAGTRISRVAPGAEGGGHDDLGLSWRAFSSPALRASGTRLAFIGASPVAAPAVVVYDSATGEETVVRRSLGQEIDPGWISVPEPISFPSPGVPPAAGDPPGGPVAHAFYYPPASAAYRGPAGERPPLVVMSHGGPTAGASTELRLETQFFTSRGFAVVDVNYGGSTGYGRAYRERLKGRWGILDVDDCVAAARFLAARGDVDPARLAIRGGSAGGYTTLCALTFRDDFAAGASYYGVADAETLARDTHKFESRYLDSLIGPYPEARQIYWERSPIHYADRLSCPVILLQGLEDKIVPPDQAEEMVAALRRKGLPFAYLSFPGEQHGFRKAETIRRALEAEAYFYARVFGFQLADEVEPVPMENLS
jgi:dipeptidyl aminopeptidase/acylaminoacyl peptidase